MKIKTPLTKQRLRTHFTYHLWKYLLAAALTVFCVNLLYTTTAYRSPENLRVDIYMQSTTATQEKVDAFMKDVWQRSVPDMETVSTILLTAGSTDDYYSNMQLSVYLMAGEGDLYALSTEDFKRFAAQGVFIDLTPYVESGALNVEGIDMIHLGLNDLHLALGMKFMFELLSDGTVDRLAAKIKAKGIPFGFGGVATLTGGAMPGSMVIKEHYRLGSSMVIVSRSFCNTDKITDLEEVRRIFQTGIADIRRLEEEADRAANYFSNNHLEVIENVKDIIRNK